MESSLVFVYLLEVGVISVTWMDIKIKYVQLNFKYALKGLPLSKNVGRCRILLFASFGKERNCLEKY